jgi:hypothetical protein
MKFEEQNGFMKLILHKNRHQFHYIRSQKPTNKPMSSRVATHKWQCFFKKKTLCELWAAIYIGKKITIKVWERLIPRVEGMLNAIQVQNPNKFER